MSPAARDIAEDEGEMLHRVERRRIGKPRALPIGVSTSKRRLLVDETLARLAIGDEVGDRDDLEAMLAGEGDDLRPALDRAVVIDELADDAGRMQAGEPGEIDRRLGMARAHQDAARFGDERKHMAGAHEVGGMHIAVGQGVHGGAALLGRDAGGEALAVVDRDGEGRAERRIVDAPPSDRA